MLTAIAAKYMIGGQGILFGRAVTSFIAFLPQTPSAADRLFTAFRRRPLHHEALRGLAEARRLVF
jgi:hypothetical protein